jgi:mono/diheme cytochrome c family protein
MKLLIRLAAVLVGLVLLLVLGGLGYLFLALPRVGAAKEVRVEVTPERVARGKYLANHVAFCTVCHSERDWTKFGAPILPGREGNGGMVWGHAQGLPGELRPGNLTSAGLKDWTDGEIIRAITEGISRDGTPLFPFMPYPEYGSMPSEDVLAIVAYLRSLPAVSSPDEEPFTRELDFPVNLIVRTIPRPATPTRVDPSDREAYGHYLVKIASCEACHSKRDGGTIMPETRLAGGAEFLLPNGGTVRSANITPDPATGIGAWSEEQFIARFKLYEDASAEALTLQDPHQNTHMPWVNAAGMTREDLAAIYAYLRTVTPVVQKVRTFEGTPPSSAAR